VAGADRMTIEEVVKRVLLDEHADVIREAVKAVAAEMMELEVSELIGAEYGARGDALVWGHWDLISAAAEPPWPAAPPQSSPGMWCRRWSVRLLAAQAAWSSGISSLISLCVDFSGSVRQRAIDSAER